MSAKTDFETKLLKEWMDQEKHLDFTNFLINKIYEIELKLVVAPLKTKYTNLSKRLWSEEECRIMVNASLLKLIADAGGTITMLMSDVLKVCENGQGTLALSLSNDDKILTLTRLKVESQA